MNKLTWHFIGSKIATISLRMVRKLLTSQANIFDQIAVVDQLLDISRTFKLHLIILSGGQKL